MCVELMTFVSCLPWTCGATREKHNNRKENGRKGEKRSSISSPNYKNLSLSKKRVKPYGDSQSSP